MRGHGAVRWEIMGSGSGGSHVDIREAFHLLQLVACERVGVLEVKGPSEAPALEEQGVPARMSCKEDRLVLGSSRSSIAAITSRGRSQAM